MCRSYNGATKFQSRSVFSGVIKVPYSGGNSGKYSSGNLINSIGNTGLSIKLRSGILETGKGFLIYDVSGIPTLSSPEAAIFNIDFNAFSCSIRVGEIELASITTKATLGPLVPTNNNGADVFHRAITTSDGKFSVRVFISPPYQLGQADIHIRSNGAPAKIMWNAVVSYQGGTLGNATNLLDMTLPNTWYGNKSGDNGPTADPISSTNKNIAWGNEDVYFNAPEQRSYVWTSTEVSDKTTYILTFMMGAPNPSIVINSTTANQVKAFLKVEQIKSND